MKRPILLTIMGIIACAAMLSMPILVGPPAENVYPDIVRFLGRFHPVILHLPIGMLVLALLLEFGSIFTRKESPALQSTLFFTAVTSVVAVLAGFLLFQTDDFGDSPGAILHLWGGIAFSCLCIATFLIKAWTDSGASAAWLYKVLLVTTSGVMAYASHEGASLTHGPDYLGKYAPEPLRKILGGKPTEEKKPEAAVDAVVAETLVYQDIVAPMLEEKCWKCHNEGKIKGKLRMDTYELLVKGGKEGSALDIGHAEKSNIIIRMELPIEEEERMPPDEKPGLKPEEIAVIKWWINAGAKPDLTLAAANPPADIAATIAKLKPAASKTAAVAPVVATTVAPAADISKERATILGSINELQKAFPGAAQFESQSSNAVNFTAVSMRGTFSDKDAQKLTSVAAHLTSVDFTATLVTDASLAHLKSATKLKTLRLGETKITNAGVATIAGFTSLESLNLFGTEVTDEAIQKLAPLKSLKHLYLWRSKVTPEGVEALRKALPNCDIVMGIS
jgi:uncharacterized membrane protein